MSEMTYEEFCAKRNVLVEQIPVEVKEYRQYAIILSWELFHKAPYEIIYGLLETICNEDCALAYKLVGAKIFTELLMEQLRDAAQAIVPQENASVAS